MPIELGTIEGPALEFRSLPMELKNILGVLALSIIFIVIGLMVPKGEQETQQTFPWQIEKTATGSIKVFDLILGESTLADAEQRFKSLAVVSLFAKPDGIMATEVYFEKIELGGLSAKIVIVTDLSQEALSAMYSRGSRISTLGSGTNKVTLSSEDLNRIRHSRIDSLAYLPRTSLEEEVINARFGEPSEIIVETVNKTTHWLYPEQGLDLAINEKGNAVLQYISPKKFERHLLKPLRQLQEAQEQADVEAIKSS